MKIKVTHDKRIQMVTATHENTRNFTVHDQKLCLQSFSYSNTHNANADTHKADREVCMNCVTGLCVNLSCTTQRFRELY